MGLLLCLGGEVDEGGVRLFWGGGLLRLGDLEGRRLGTGDRRLGEGDPDSLLFCGPKGVGLYRRWMGGEYRLGEGERLRGGGEGDLRLGGGEGDLRRLGGDLRPPGEGERLFLGEPSRCRLLGEEGE